MPTMQELFDRAVSGVKAQGRLSRVSDTDGECRYRHPDNPNVRCAVGHLIPDDLYDPAMEGRDALDVLAHFPKLAEALGSDSRPRVSAEWELLADLQEVHDVAETVVGFLHAARRVGNEYGLNTGVCNVHEGA